MIDEFGDFFDRHGLRYQLRGATVAYQVHRNITTVYVRHRIKLTAKITNDYILSKPDAERVAREVQRQLSRDGASFLEETVVTNG
ncbi:unnamed protein product [Heligmosomoides polygyrus]|uniref:BON domain-containing protein n=1 Tax=Heligmosomoides polygyrus TaxID=6339 RepID=A0A183GWH5_HELPZ|nr:unnamed protein product [Heligmosomoides polygyrus]